MGHPLSELEDALAKAAALEQYKAARPAKPPSHLYDLTYVLAEWLWLTDLPADCKKANGSAEVEGNFSQCPIQPPPTWEQLRNLMQPVSKQAALTITPSGAFLT